MMTAGCGQRPYETTGPIVEAMAAFSRQGPQGATVSVAQVAPQAWDRVHLFREGTTWEAIRQTAGAGTFPGRSGRYDEPGALLVFTEGDQVSAAVAVIPPLFVSSMGRTFDREGAKLRAHSKDPGPYLLMLE